MNKVPEIDERFVDIGDLPTGFAPYKFKEMYVREFTLAELKLLYIGMHSKQRPLQHIIRAIQMCCTAPIAELTDGDFEFLMARLRKSSYPKAPLQVNWTCRHTNIVYKDNRTFYRGPPIDARQMALGNMEYEQCNTNNVETVTAYRTQIESLDDDDLVIKDTRFDFPRVATLGDYHAHIEEAPHEKHLAECARWIRRGKTFRDKFVYLMSRPDLDLYQDILEVRKKYYHGIVEEMQLRCRVCDHRWTHNAAPRLLSFFADNSEEDIFKIMYNLLSEFGMQPDMKMPAKLVLFTYSHWAKDRQEAANRKGGFKPLG